MQTFLTRAALGPLWPFMLLAALFLAATTGFLLFVRFRSAARAYSSREYGFLVRLYDATELCGSLTLICGILGTGLALMQILPALSRAPDPGQDALYQQLLAALPRLLSPALAGLLLGGLWAEILRYFLRPYARRAACQLPGPLPQASRREPEPKPPPEQDFDNDWRAKDPLGFY